MSIQNEIDRITNNVAEAYTAVEEKGGTVPEEANSDKLAEAIRSIESGEAAAYAVNAPIGSIILWSGPESTIPPGWHICDGTNDTEDLSGRFALGASDDHPIGETGGEEEVTLTIEQMPEHKHTYVSFTYGTAYNTYYPEAINKTANQENISTNPTGSSEPHPNMPPYIALYYIQKISATPTDYTTREDVEELVGLPVKPITEAEYSALSDEDKNGETAWLVTDAEGSSGNGDDGSDSDGGEIYSTEEVRIGTWIDGKPLYRRCFLIDNVNFTNKRYDVPNTFDFVQNISIANSSGHVGNASLKICINGIWLTSYSILFCRCYINKNIGLRLSIDNLNISNEPSDGSLLNSISGWFSIEYTKTTD